MNIARRVHVEADLLDGVCDVGAGNRQVLECSGDAAVGGDVVNGLAIGS